MKKTLLLLAALTTLAISASAQSYNVNVGGIGYSSGVGVPASCLQNGYWYFNQSNSTWYQCISGTWTIIGSGGGGGGTVSPGTSNQTVVYSGTGTVVGGVGPGLTNQVLTSNGTSAAPSYNSPGVTTRAVVGTTDIVLCDSGTTTRDRANAVSYANAGTITVTLPDAGSTGCGAGFPVQLVNLGVGTVTVNRQTSSTITNCTGAACTSGLTTFNILVGQYATIKPDSTGTNWLSTISPTAGGTVTNAANLLKCLNASGTGTTGVATSSAVCDVYQGYNAAFPNDACAAFNQAATDGQGITPTVNTFDMRGYGGNTPCLTNFVHAGNVAVQLIVDSKLQLITGVSQYSPQANVTIISPNASGSTGQNGFGFFACGPEIATYTTGVTWTPGSPGVCTFALAGCTSGGAGTCSVPEINKGFPALTAITGNGTTRTATCATSCAVWFRVNQPVSITGSAVAADNDEVILTAVSAGNISWLGSSASAGGAGAMASYALSIHVPHGEFDCLAAASHVIPPTPCQIQPVFVMGGMGASEGLGLNNDGGTNNIEGVAFMCDGEPNCVGLLDWNTNENTNVTRIRTGGWKSGGGLLNAGEGVEMGRKECCSGQVSQGPTRLNLNHVNMAGGLTSNNANAGNIVIDGEDVSIYFTRGTCSTLPIATVTGVTAGAISGTKIINNGTSGCQTTPPICIVYLSATTIGLPLSSWTTTTCTPVIGGPSNTVVALTIGAGTGFVGSPLTGGAITLTDINTGPVSAGKIQDALLMNGVIKPSVDGVHGLNSLGAEVHIGNLDAVAGGVLKNIDVSAVTGGGVLIDKGSDGTTCVESVINLPGSLSVTDNAVTPVRTISDTTFQRYCPGNEANEGQIPADSTGAGNNAGTTTWVQQAGGNTSGAASTAGIGGNYTMTGGQGGAALIANGIGGAGGAINLVGGAGGASLGTAVNSAGGNIIFTPGAAGTGGGGTAGTAGLVRIGGSLNFTANAVTTGWNSNGVNGSCWLVGGAAGYCIGQITFLAKGTAMIGFASAAATGAAVGGFSLQSPASSPVMAVGNGTVGDESLLLRTGDPCRITGAVSLTGTTAVVCSWSLPALAKTWMWTCNGSYSISAGTTPALTLQMNASQAPTSETGNGVIGTVSQSGTVTQIYNTGSNTATAAGVQPIFADALSTITTLTSAPWSSSGTIQASATAGTFAIQALLTGSISPTGTINAGSSCVLQ